MKQLVKLNDESKFFYRLINKDMRIKKPDCRKNQQN